MDEMTLLVKLELELDELEWLEELELDELEWLDELEELELFAVALETFIELTGLYAAYNTRNRTTQQYDLCVIDCYLCIVLA
jgi:hypothetical protein